MRKLLFYQFSILLIACCIFLALALSVQALRRVQGQTTVTTVSAASYMTTLSPNGIASAYGTKLATQTLAAAGLPLPTSLGGTTVRVNGQLSPLFFVSPNQINFLIPDNTPIGSQSVTITSSDGTVSTGTVQLSNTAPAIFTANASGSGIPAGLLLRLKINGAQVFEPIGPPIEFQLNDDRLFLILYLCGVRHAAPNSVRVIIGGAEITPSYFGEAPGFAGLDQINLELPRSLSGRGQTSLIVSVNGNLNSNAVRIDLGGAMCGAIYDAILWKLPSELIAQLPLSELEQDGFTLVENGLRRRPKPAVGYWVKVGEETYQTDKNGIFRVSAVHAGVLLGNVYRRLSDANTPGRQPLHTFPLSLLSNTCENISPIIVELEVSGITSMSGDDIIGNGQLLESNHGKETSLSQMIGRVNSELAGCTLWWEAVPGQTEELADPIGVIGLAAYHPKKGGCCLDYNGPTGNKSRYKRTADCGFEVLRNFYRSTCYEWIWGIGNKTAVCDNEILQGVVGRGIACWDNHKYRNCQQMAPDKFEIVAPPAQSADFIVVEFTGDVSQIIVITNETPANETKLTVSGDIDGKLDLNPLPFPVLTDNDQSFGGGRYSLAMYSDKAKTHFSARVLSYTAPRLPRGSTPRTAMLVFESYGKTKTLQIKQMPSND
jgi:uncharacterized protein (TIGR03437 family)